jgi:hypothetical protein
MRWRMIIIGLVGRMVLTGCATTTHTSLSEASQGRDGDAVEAPFLVTILPSPPHYIEATDAWGFFAIEPDSDDLQGELILYASPGCFADDEPRLGEPYTMKGVIRDTGERLVIDITAINQRDC